MDRDQNALVTLFDCCSSYEREKRAFFSFYSLFLLFYYFFSFHVQTGLEILNEKTLVCDPGLDWIIDC